MKGANKKERRKQDGNGKKRAGEETNNGETATYRIPDDSLRNFTYTRDGQTLLDATDQLGKAFRISRALRRLVARSGGRRGAVNVEVSFGGGGLPGWPRVVSRFRLRCFFFLHSGGRRGW